MAHTMATSRQPPVQQRVIGLTGGIATGKTTVSDYLASQHGLPVFDADLFARDAVAPGTPALEAIATRFGPDILLPDGNLDRRALGAIVFADPAERQWLEAQIHPQVRARFLDAIARCDRDALVLAIPLLFEARLEGLATEIWVVACSPELQLARLMDRDRLAAAQARARIAAQMPLAEKIARADCVLDNSGPIENLLHQIDMKVRSH